MKTQSLLCALAVAAAISPLAARAEVEVSMDFFYENLSPYGEWLEVGEYGTCWRPNDVDGEWTPYTDGYWSYTDAGWTWISYEDFGDICYHYGRWVRTDDVGWVWVPDYEWGPAWVSWRKSDDYIGWAPLPPEARWRPSVGFSVWVDDSYDIGPSYYNFCPVVEFGAPVLRSVCVPRSRAVVIFGSTINITNISFNSYNRRVFCGGPDYSYISRFSRRPVPALKLVQNTTIINNNTTIINNRSSRRAPRNIIAGNTLQVFAPKVVNRPDSRVRPNINRVIARPQIDKGWASIKDQSQRTTLRDKVRRESKGLTPSTAPARPVQVADLKPVPQKADTSAPSPVRVTPGRGRGSGAPDGRGGVPTRSDAGRPQTPPVAGKPPATQPPAGAPSRPSIPSSSDSSRGRVTGERPDRPGSRDRDDRGTASRPQVMPPAANQPTRPSVPSGNSVTKPFRDGPNVTRTPATPQVPQTRQPATAPSRGTARQPQSPSRNSAQEQQMRLQRAQQEQLEKQRQAAAAADRQRSAQSAAQRSQQMQAQEKARAQAQRQQQLQQQAQALRQQQMQRQMQQQQQQQRQRSAVPQQQPRSQVPQARPQASRPQFQQPARPQAQPRSAPRAGGGGGRQLTPEQAEAMRKRR